MRMLEFTDSTGTSRRDALLNRPIKASSVRSRLVPADDLFDSSRAVSNRQLEGPGSLHRLGRETTLSTAALPRSKGSCSTSPPPLSKAY